jgi:hypothetical protein
MIENDGPCQKMLIKCSKISGNDRKFNVIEKSNECLITKVLKLYIFSENIFNLFVWPHPLNKQGWLFFTPFLAQVVTLG